MRVIHLASNDILGGAAKAAYSIHSGLRQAGLESIMIVSRKDSDEPSIIGPEAPKDKLGARMRPRIDKRLTRALGGKPTSLFTSNFLGSSSVSNLDRFTPDIIHLHWVRGGFVRPSQLSNLACPLVWTLWDMWPFTGGCHYDGGCGRHIQGCGKCPILQSTREFDLSKWNAGRKRKHFAKAQIIFISPSEWMKREASRSSVLRDADIEVVHPGVDVKLFTPIERDVAKQALGLSIEDRVLAYVAPRITDQRKGWHVLLRALAELATPWGTRGFPTLFMTVGSAEDRDLREISVRHQHIGKVNDQAFLRLIYSAADALVLPSLQEGFGLVGAEAMSCGTPALAFSDTGAEDLIEDRVTGYVAEFGSSSAIAKGIGWLFAEQDRLSAMRATARKRSVEHFSMEAQTEKYIDTYERLLQRRHPSK